MSEIQKIHINTNGETICYVPYKDYKKMKQSYEDKIRNLKKQKAEEIEMENGFKIETFSGYKWYVISENNNEKLLFMKDKLPVDKIKELFSADLLDTFYDVRFNPSGENIWSDSPIRMALNSKFLEGLDKSRMNLMTTDINENITKDYVRLITECEVKNLPIEIRKCNGGYGYWTLSPYVYCRGFMWTVFSDGRVIDDDIYCTYGVRPVISIKVGDTK